MRIFPVQQFLLLLTLGLAPISVHAIDYHSLFKEFKQTEWIRFDTMKWARNYVSSRESMVIVVQYDTVREEVRFQTWKRCEKPDQTETLQWVARELFGTRSNCDDTVTRTEVPQDLEEKIGELPKPINEILNVERGMARKRMPTPATRLRI